ncbi:sugar transferase [Gloeobacter kilaueensis]|uniref:Undecaprenyl-phosphate galactose phosphotransferase n=1 Tax=Gloeobacter kilaueensis (strain ATCC BAA-2537 / CCAP 1431/1 / ULC 316 / JS1) TaxID=1183438 RepID=U5QR90_GLOK1|nr:sugar transferase [Gloeobacter kilaueensis]AGY60235.1 undecaprenyl-phosphate galactose phosphotransferase [Gloeobacter kilaueensis JS1]
MQTLSQQVAATPKFAVLGKVLVEMGLVNEYQLHCALDYQKEEAEHFQKWRLLGEIFVEWGLITRSQLVAAVDRQYLQNEKWLFRARTHPSARSLGKRTIDLVGAAVGLSLTACLLPAIALAIYLEDRGPIFFAQPRMGLRGRQFTIWKFRSMVPDAEARKLTVAGSSIFFSPAADPRITGVGRVLRKLNLDELPQFWNVLLGQMSLVGTRPPTLDEVKHYSETQWQRLLVKPGITGLWQVSGSRHAQSFDQVLQLDSEYQQSWSVRRDLAIVFKTLYCALFRRGRL